MSGVVHATMVRGLELHLSGVWQLQACMERTQNQEEDCDQSDESVGWV